MMHDVWARARVAFNFVGAQTRRGLSFADAMIEPLRQAWMTALVALIVLLALLAPTLASEQVSEAILDQAPDPTRPWRDFACFTALATLAAFAALSLSLRYWSARLMSAVPGTVQRQFGLLAIWAAPWLALAICFLKAATALGTLWNPFTVLAVVSVGLPTIVYARARKLSGVFDSNSIIRGIAQVAMPAIFGVGVVVFGVNGIWDEVAVAQALGPTALLAFALAAFTALGAWLIVAGRRTRLPLFWLALAMPILFGYFNLNDNHHIRYADRIDVNDVKLISLEQAVDGWLALRPTESPIILVSAEGGGIRASYFTAIALARIADRCPIAANRIFAISTVSGGSIGAAVYAATVHARPIPINETRCDFNGGSGPGWYEQQIDDVFRQDHLSPILSRYLFPDALQRFVPFRIDEFDRQRGLEDSLAQAFEERLGGDVLNDSFYALTPNQERPSTPYLLVNTTSVDRGQHVVASPLYFNLGDQVHRTRTFQDIDWSKNFSLIAMAGTSARFPFLSPSGYVRNGDSVERFVDGGYFDNSGAVTVLEVYRNLITLSSYDDTVAHSPIVLLHIGNQPVCPPTQGVLRNGRPCIDQDRTGPNLDELLAPLQAVMNAREAHVQYVLEELEGAAFQRLDHHDETMRIQMVKRGVPVPLGWFLSARAANELMSQLDSNPDADCAGGEFFSNTCVFRRLGARALQER